MPSGFVTPAAGGGSQPITRATYNLAATLPTSNALTKATWTFNYGTALLNLTDPTNPTPVVSGTYSFAVWALAPDDDVAGILWGLQTTVDANDFGAAIRETGSLVRDSRAKALAVTLPFYVPAGSPCFVELNYSGGAPMSVTGTVQLQRLS